MTSLDTSSAPSSFAVPSSRVTLNEDVLRVICQIIRCSKEDRTDKSNSYRDRLRNAALAFRAMKDPALDALWHTLPSLVPLFALHPCVALEDNEFVLRPTNVDDWDIFDRYAIRVRCLTTLERDPLNRQISPYVAEFLSRLRPYQALLPALKELHLPKINKDFDGRTRMPVISNNLHTLEFNAVHNKSFVTTLLCYLADTGPGK
ncbi:hypothetical protein BJ165DRAFT_1052243 [Panaeolus papilionaceus]|nr:hypothetical protein BJ165DRAFT_1052243 [Panaeolus papilionaceus]